VGARLLSAGLGQVIAAIGTIAGLGVTTASTGGAPGMPEPSPLPDLPGFDSVPSSAFLFFGYFSALAVFLAAAAARPSFPRRGDARGARPSRFSLLLERPG
jgi:hypothetical protein